MKNIDFTFNSDDKKVLHATKWMPSEDKPVRGVVQIAHGMAEHRSRYSSFAAFLNENGFIVYADDHRGHGQTIEIPEQQGFFAESDGWNRVVKDLSLFTELISKENPGLPLFLLGHSMGSLLLRTLIIDSPVRINGVILSGTAGSQGLLGKVGKLIAKGEVKKKGAVFPSKKMDNLSFGAFNKAFRPNRTDFDWLSRDDKQVDAYIKDPLCGFICTASLFVDLIEGVDYISDRNNLMKIPKTLPIYIFSGEKDPVGADTKGVRKVHEAYRNVGISDLSLKFYKDARHETLNEINRDEVFGDILKWIEKRL